MNSITSDVLFVMSVRQYELERLQERKTYALFTTTKNWGITYAYEILHNVIFQNGSKFLNYKP